MRNALQTRPADDTPYREDMTAYQESEHKLRTFRLFDGMPEDASATFPRPRKGRLPIGLGLVAILSVIFWLFVIGAGFIWALVWGAA